jgi:hypothetical protein
MALSISDFVHQFMNRWVAPIMKRATPKEYGVRKLISFATDCDFSYAMLLHDTLICLRNGYR